MVKKLKGGADHVIRFADVIRGSGLNPADFPKASELLIGVYGQNPLEELGKVHFPKPRSKNVPESSEEFRNYVLKLEQRLTEDSTLSSRIRIHVRKTTNRVSACETEPVSYVASYQLL